MGFGFWPGGADLGFEKRVALPLGFLVAVGVEEGHGGSTSTLVL